MASRELRSFEPSRREIRGNLWFGIANLHSEAILSL